MIKKKKKRYEVIGYYFDGKKTKTLKREKI